ncbi:MAG: glycoside hydrolase family 130 protein [Sphingobacteriaceae bacterium]
MKRILSLAFLFFVLRASAQVDSLPAWAFGPFNRSEALNPIISPDSTSTFYCPMLKKRVAWEVNDTFNPAAAVKNNKVYVLYRAEDKRGIAIGMRTSRIGLAKSKDGLVMKRRSKPVLYPAEDAQKEYEWQGGCEDPRVAVTEDGVYVMFYTMWNNKVPRIGVAHSKNLTRWKKYGPAFSLAHNGKFNNIATKSASIITKISGGRQVIAKINGKYWMYFGELHVYAATSVDLINWEPLIDGRGELRELMSPRKGFFDSHLTECGPPAIMTDKGILLLYNGKNLSNSDADPKYTPNSYCAGQAMFDLNDPSKFVSRLDKPFLIPTAAFEKSGQYPAGTVFIEGMAYFKNKWFLYYGCADSRVAVAIYNPLENDMPN